MRTSLGSNRGLKHLNLGNNKIVEEGALQAYSSMMYSNRILELVHFDGNGNSLEFLQNILFFQGGVTCRPISPSLVKSVNGRGVDKSISRRISDGHHNNKHLTTPRVEIAVDTHDCFPLKLTWVLKRSNPDDRWKEVHACFAVCLV